MLSSNSSSISKTISSFLILKIKYFIFLLIFCNYILCLHISYCIFFKFIYCFPLNQSLYPSSSYSISLYSFNYLYPNTFYIVSNLCNNLLSFNLILYFQIPFYHHQNIILLFDIIYIFYHHLILLLFLF